MKLWHLRRWEKVFLSDTDIFIWGAVKVGDKELAKKQKRLQLQIISGQPPFKNST